MGDEIQNELNEMLGTMAGLSVEKEEEEVKEEVKEEEVKEEEVIEEKEEVKEEEQKEEIVEDDKDKTITELRQRLEELSEKKTEESVKKKEEPVKKEEKKEEPLQFQEHDFVGELDPEDIIRDKKALNLVLNSIYQKAVTDAKNIIGEGTLRAIPDIVKNNIDLYTTLKKASEDFYTENKDLAPFKRVVAAVFEEVSSQNPGKGYPELMALVAPEARTRLGLQAQAVKKEKETPPRLPSKGKGGGSDRGVVKPDTSGIVNELETMNKSIGR
jgi:hypothetical protein